MEYYEAFSDLAGVVLEESWVLEVAPSAAGLALRIEVRLTPDHPRYGEPALGEMGCYRTGWLWVHSSEPVETRLSGTRPTLDPDGASDYGNVDSLVQSSEGAWTLDGDWGHAQVRDPQVRLELD